MPGKRNRRLAAQQIDASPLKRHGFAWPRSSVEPEINERIGPRRAVAAVVGQNRVAFLFGVRIGLFLRQSRPPVSRYIVKRVSLHPSARVAKHGLERAVNDIPGGL